MNAPALTRDDHAEMIARALTVCPDLGDDEAVMRHLHLLGMSVASIGATAFDALLDEARAQANRSAFAPAEPKTNLEMEEA